MNNLTTLVKTAFFRSLVASMTRNKNDTCSEIRSWNNVARGTRSDGGSGSQQRQTMGLNTLTKHNPRQIWANRNLTTIWRNWRSHLFRARVRHARFELLQAAERVRVVPQQHRVLLQVHDLHSRKPNTNRHRRQ
jgi:hypothetical protein